MNQFVRTISTVIIALSMSMIVVNGSRSDEAKGCAPHTTCLAVQENSIAQCSSGFPDYVWPSDWMPFGYTGPWFKASQSYPTTAPSGDSPWLNIKFDDGTVGAMDYLYALREYAFEGMIDADFRPQDNKIRSWFHMPMMTFGPRRREPSHGLTSERSVTGPELGLKQGTTIHNYAIGFYNAAGAVTIGEVWKSASPNLQKAKFLPGTMTFKILFSDVKAQDFQGEDLLEGAPQWNIITPLGRQSVRLVQMDVATVDPRSPTGWVFGTFAYQKSAGDLSSWRRLRPVGLSWGNDEGFTPSDQQSGKKLRETTISEPIPLYAASHLGWAGRTNGPVDNPISGCLSCHSTAQFPVVAPIVPPATCITDNQKLHWFRNFPGSRPFGAVDSTTCSPIQIDDPLFSLDFSLQMQVAVQSALQFKNANPCAAPSVVSFQFLRRFKMRREWNDKAATCCVAEWIAEQRSAGYPQSLCSKTSASSAARKTMMPETCAKAEAPERTSSPIVLPSQPCASKNCLAAPLDTAFSIALI